MRAAGFAALALAVGCGLDWNELRRSDGGRDAAPPDAMDAAQEAGMDAGREDAGMDAGGTDAGPPDTGAVDAGTDAGASDGAAPDVPVAEDAGPGEICDNDVDDGDEDTLADCRDYMDCPVATPCSVGSPGSLCCNELCAPPDYYRVRAHCGGCTLSCRSSLRCLLVTADGGYACECMSDLQCPISPRGAMQTCGPDDRCTCGTNDSACAWGQRCVGGRCTY